MAATKQNRLCLYFTANGVPLRPQWTNWPLFTVGMIQRGYSDDAIQKILGGNILRVARAVGENRA